MNTHWFAEKVEEFLNGLTQRRKGAEEVGSRKEELGIGKEEKGERGSEWPRVRVFYEEALLGSGGTLWANREWVDDGEPFFVLYGDNLTNVDLGKMWEFHGSHGLPFTLGVFKAENPSACGIAEVDGDGVVTGFVEKPGEPKSDLAAAGVYVADWRIFDFFPEDAGSRMPLDLGFDVIPRLVGRMKAYVIDEFLMDIGTADSYEKAQEIYPQIFAD